MHYATRAELHRDDSERFRHSAVSFCLSFFTETDFLDDVLTILHYSLHNQDDICVLRICVMMFASGINWANLVTGLTEMAGV